MRLCNYGEGEEGGGWDVCVQMRVRERGVCGMHDVRCAEKKEFCDQKMYSCG